MKQLILGGTRSGKSELANRLAMQSRLQVVFIATATPGDDEMKERIALHARSRSPDWLVIQEPVNLVQVMARYAAPERCLLVDCLTLWLSNLMDQNVTQNLEVNRKALMHALTHLAGDIILVSSEIGLGVIPLGAQTRRYCDELGWLHQGVAENVDRVIFTMAGLPMVLKGEPL